MIPFSIPTSNQPVSLVVSYEYILNILLDSLLPPWSKQPSAPFGQLQSSPNSSPCYPFTSSPHTSENDLRKTWLRSPLWRLRSHTVITSKFLSCSVRLYGLWSAPSPHSLHSLFSLTLILLISFKVFVLATLSSLECSSSQNSCYFIQGLSILSLRQAWGWLHYHAMLYFLSTLNTMRLSIYIYTHIIHIYACIYIYVYIIYIFMCLYI